MKTKGPFSLIKVLTYSMIIVISSFLSCNKDDDKKGGCSFTWDGENYSSTSVDCLDPEVYSENSDFCIFISPADDWIQLECLGDGAFWLSENANLTISGNTISFNVKLYEDGDVNGAYGTINGKCECSTGSL